MRDPRLLLLIRCSKLQGDRFIKIYIGDDINPYHVQEAALTTLSDYFVRALKHGKSFGGEEETLGFPEDDQTSWQTLLHWKIKGSLTGVDGLREREAIEQWTKCWVLGNKYDVKEFQDLVFLELLKCLDGVDATPQAVEFAFKNTPANSPMRQLMAREAVASFDRQDFAVFDGVNGATIEVVDAMKWKQERERSNAGLITKLDEPTEWQKFMVGEGTFKHWVWKRCERKDRKDRRSSR